MFLALRHIKVKFFFKQRLGLNTCTEILNFLRFCSTFYLNFDLILLCQWGLSRWGTTVRQAWTIKSEANLVLPWQSKFVVLIWSHNQDPDLHFSPIKFCLWCPGRIQHLLALNKEYINLSKFIGGCLNQLCLSSLLPALARGTMDEVA